MGSRVFVFGLFSFFAVALFSCKSTKETTTTTRVLHDTIATREIVTVIPPQRNVTIIDSPCRGDSLKPINYISKTKSAEVKIESRGNDLVVSVDIDSIVNSRLEEERIKLDQTETIKEKVITKTRIPKFVWYVITYAVLLTLYTFRKFIPYLNLIP
jgi:DNA-binding protein